MSNFLCRWPNGDLTFVSAPDRNEAIITLDQIGDATEAQLLEGQQPVHQFYLNR
jgi:hypothetical protein